MTRCPMCEVKVSDQTSPLGLCPGCLLNLGLNEPPPVSPAPAPARRRRIPRTLLFSVLAGIVAMLLFTLFRSGPRPVPPVRFQIDPPLNTEFAPADRFDVSPDGTRLAFTATGVDGERHLWVRALDSFAAQQLPHTSDARLPFWSPDGRAIAFFAQGKLQRVSLHGEPPQTICASPRARGGAWSRAGVIVFAPDSAGGLFQVAETGGTPQPVTTLDRARQEVSHRWPRFLSDGRRYLFAAVTQDGKSAVYAGTLGSQQRKLAVPQSAAAAIAERHVLFVRDHSLLAQGFNPRGLQTLGDPVPVPFAGELRGAAFAAGEGQVLAYRPSPPQPTQVAWFDREGKLLGSAAAAESIRGPALSPDGKMLATARRDPTGAATNLWLTDLAREVTSRFTFGAGHDTSPVWSPDGRAIAFVNRQADAAGIYQRPVDGTDNQRLLLRSRQRIRLDSWSPDGLYLVFTQWSANRKAELWLLPLDGNRKPAAYLAAPFDVMQGQISPDGRWMAYVSNETGRPEVFVQSFPAASAKWQASADGGTRPRWRHDSAELFYGSREHKLIAVQMRGAGHALFSLAGRGPYAVADGGQRFLVEAPAPGVARPAIHVVLGWAGDLRYHH